MNASEKNKYNKFNEIKFWYLENKQLSPTTKEENIN